MRLFAVLLLAGCASLPSAAPLEIRMEPEAVQGDEVQLYVRVLRGGEGGLRVELVKARDGGRREVASRGPAPAGGETLKIGFPAPERGCYTVRAESGGAVVEAPLHVTARRLRVLYVEHPPRYEYRFIKNALVRDPELRAHCLLTSADEGFPQEHTRDDDPFFREPLARFPPDLRTLLEFDVLIFGDVDPAALGPQAGRDIDAFVREFGGGLVFLPGMMNNPRALAGTPLANLLPVVPVAARDPSEHEKVYDAVYGYALTPAGQASPVTGFEEFRDACGSGSIPGIRWFQRVNGVKSGASVLVELTGAGSPRPPLFVTMPAGRGRVFWSATDETWLWRRLTGDFPYFYPFWKRAIEWAARGG